MKWYTVTAIAGTLTLGTSLAAVADDMTPTAMGLGGQPITGQIESIQGSQITVKTASGETQNYKVSPTIISALKLEKGSNIVIDGSRLKSGKIKHLDAYTAEIQLDGGDLKTYILTREARRYLAMGDRVIIESGGTRIVRVDRYVLSSSELRMQSATVASSSSSASVASSKVEVEKANTGGGTLDPAPQSAPPPPEPVSGLW
jgi:outer membrane lipoprotein SlyB